MRPRKRDRLYQRAGDRWYADLRDIGGEREAMRPEGESYATTNRDVAAMLCAARVRELEEGRRSRQLLGVKRRVSIGQFATEWVSYRLQTELRPKTVLRYQLAFGHAFRVMADATDMDRIGVADVKLLMAGLRALPTRRGVGLSSSSIRQVFVAMAQLFDHAEVMGVIPLGSNPWKSLPKSERPKPKKSDTEFLEVDEAAALLTATESIRTRSIPLRTLVATFLLTGGRLNEVLGLEWSDINFDREIVLIRPNRWRLLKRGTTRAVPLWPQLRAELEAYRASTGKIGGLVFPGTDATGTETKTWGKLYKHLDRAARIAGIEKRITPQVFRVTYCAARLQTMDNGAPVAAWTVKTEMGHSSLSMVEKVYGRLGTVRHRSNAVEYLRRPASEQVAPSTRFGGI